MLMQARTFREASKSTIIWSNVRDKEQPRLGIIIE